MSTKHNQDQGDWTLEKKLFFRRLIGIGVTHLHRKEDDNLPLEALQEGDKLMVLHHLCKETFQDNNTAQETMQVPIETL